MTLLQRWIVRSRKKRLVRPWALLAPVVVLLIALPLLRPLRHRDMRMVSDTEMATLATVQAAVEHHTLAIEKTDFAATDLTVSRGRHLYADQPPMMAALLAPSYWVMHRMGLTFANSPHLVAYLLTLLGVTLPVAGGTGLVYRMGRLFELRRPWRAGLALAVVLGSGFISYATVLNPHAPAAALVLSASACFIHVTITKRRLPSAVWLTLAGLCASLAATIDPTALMFLFLCPLVVLALRWPVPSRVGGLLLFCAGTALPLIGHAQLTGSLTRGWGVHAAHVQPAQSSDAHDGAEDEPVRQTFWGTFAAETGRFMRAWVGPHGVFSHFPVIALGILGVTMIMHRHWPTTTKMLASVSLAAGLTVVVLYGVRGLDPGNPMFAARWYVVFLPLILFWAGAWLRRGHRPGSWVAAGILLAFSVTASLLGATGPMPRHGFGTRANGSDRYTVAGAARNLVRPGHADFEPPPAALAGRYRTSLPADGAVPAPATDSARSDN